MGHASDVAPPGSSATATVSTAAGHVPGQESSAAVISFTPLPIAGHCNNQAISAECEIRSGRFNVWGNSFPAADLPEPGGRVQVAGIPFDFPVRGAGGDNIRCDGQLVAVPPGHWDWLHLLTAAERRAEDTVALHFESGDVDFEALRVSDFWAAQARFGEERAFGSSVMHYPHHVQPRLSALIWGQRVPVTRQQRLTAVRLPRNVAIHVFAATLQSVEVTAADATAADGTAAEARFAGAGVVA